MKKWFQRHFLDYGYYDHKIVVDWTDIGVPRREHVIRKWMQKDEARRLSLIIMKPITYSPDQSSPEN